MKRILSTLVLLTLGLTGCVYGPGGHGYRGGEEGYRGEAWRGGGEGYRGGADRENREFRRDHESSGNWGR